MDRPWLPKLDGKLRKRVGLVGTVVLIFVAAIGILFFGDALGRSSGYWDAQAERHANHYQNESTQEVNRCFARSKVPASVQECVEKAVKSSHENQRDERDLSAQRQMAKWAWWLLIVTAVQAPLTALGLLFLLITIWQGREANQLNSDTAKRQLRAYIMFQVVDVKLAVGHPIVIKVKVENYGKTPAKSFYFSSCAVTRAAGWKWASEPAADDVESPQKSDVHPNEERYAIMKSDENLAEANLKAVLDGGHHVFATGVGYYETVFGTPCETHYAIEFGPEEIGAAGVTPRLSEQGNYAT